jgi:uncharacterized protein YggT (Ycf19 family)
MRKNQTESHYPFRGDTIPWQTPIDDYRKTTVSLILAPYLINIKKLYLPIMLLDIANIVVLGLIVSIKTIINPIHR